MYYYNPTTNQYAKVLGVDDRTGMATVVIDDKPRQMPWMAFLGEFTSMASVSERKDEMDKRPQ